MRGTMVGGGLIAVLLIAGSVPSRGAEERTSANTPKLKQLLEKRPQADINRDGVLTMPEARAFQARLKEIREKRAKAAKRARQQNPPTQSDVAYGPHERNVLDFWQAEGNGPRPLVIYIHGGGWVGGDKTNIRPDALERLLDAGISVASINYRYSTQKPFPAPMRDGGLAVQFLRHHAKEFNIDPERVACFGGSAGAVTSLWLAFHDDMADPNASDPVLKQSTRLKAAGAIVAPTTLDKKTMDEWFGMKTVMHPAHPIMLGVSSEEELYSPEVREVAAKASPIHHLSSDDPPAFLDYPQKYKPLGKQHTPGEMVHHPVFGEKLKEAADKIGAPVVLNTTKDPQTQFDDLIDFLIQKTK
ncbi:Carboxylesterase NlhH [Planctomycetes bacterium Pan216]|uniref:Carboxylesterase NlhH n=1 Tax=Kolteria novifilia TaxID=2527975 RepID=A0A518BAV6_9BACT|nr:Carboxylesterase NlhH [Planctomycetes bacterium Pan216]